MMGAATAREKLQWKEKNLVGFADVIHRGTGGGGGGTCGRPPSLDVIRGRSPELVMGEDLHEPSVTGVAALKREHPASMTTAAPRRVRAFGRFSPEKPRRNVSLSLLNARPYLR